MAKYDEERAKRNSRRLEQFRFNNRTKGGYTPWVGKELSQEEWDEVRRYDYEHGIVGPQTKRDLPPEKDLPPVVNSFIDLIFDRVCCNCRLLGGTALVLAGIALLSFCRAVYS